MKEKINATTMYDFFKKKSERKENTSYIGVLKAYNEELHTLLYDYYESTTKCGLSIENKLDNPTTDQITYMNNIIGSEFNMSKEFITNKLQKWIQTLNYGQSSLLSDAMYDTFSELSRVGKNESALKNAYVKFMCWLYYRFRSVLSQLGKEENPKILYEGSITTYELYMLDLLCKCGCDVLILDYGIDEKVKKESIFPKYIANSDTTFPSNFSIKLLKEEMKDNKKMTNMCGTKSIYKLCKNAWMNDTIMEEIKNTNRSTDKALICSSYLKYTGVKDRNSYVNDLFSLYTDIKSNNRQIKIIEDGVQPPTAIEVNVLNRVNCNNVYDIIAMIMNNIILKDTELLKYAKQFFYQYIVSKKDMPTHKLEEEVLKTLIVFNRYSSLFNMDRPGCLFILERKALTQLDYTYFEMLSNFPIDIVIFNPDKISDGIKTDVLEFEKEDKLSIEKFPTSKVDNSYSTTAYNANNDLTKMLYQDTGMYRNRQYQRAESVILKTIYDEIDILWREDISMRQGFSTTDNVVTIPTIFAKVCGVKDGNKKQYVKSIERLVIGNENVLYYKEKIPLVLNQGQLTGESYGLGYMMNAMLGNKSQKPSMPVNIATVMTNGKIDKEKLKKHESFKYNYMREETVDYMIDKLEELVMSNLIEGVGTHGVENTVLNVFFNIPKDIVGMIQKFDFCKINPKIVYVNTGENILSLEESILLQYLSLLGFDIVMFIPTGYNVVEKYFSKKLFTEYQLGEYMYNLNVDVRKKKGFFS